MDTFQISVKTLPRHLLNLGTETPLTAEQLKALLEQNNAVVRNPNFATFRLRDQTFIPHYALELSTSKYHFRENSNLEIVDIEYPKLLTGRGATISNNINYILDYMFNYWTINSATNLLVVPFVKDGQQKKIFVGPGIMLNEEGKILCSLVYKKELITKLNLVDGFQKFKDFYSLYSRTSNQDLPIKLEDFMNENGLILFSKEFAQKPEYQRFYKAIINIFVNGLKYSLDNIYTDTIEKHIYNLPIDTTLDVNFKNMREKLDFCREVLKKSILT